MRRLRPFFVLLSLAACVAPFPIADAAEAAFEGVWTGGIVTPNTDTELGLAFTRTPKGLLVNVHFPEMFLHSANFGFAAIREDTFSLAPLDLALGRDGDQLTGTFAPAKFPAELRRGGVFSNEIPPLAFQKSPDPSWTHLGAQVDGTLIAFPVTQ